MVLVQWFSNFGVHQNHSEGLLKHTLLPYPSLSDLGIRTEKFYFSKNFPSGPVLIGFRTFTQFGKYML